MPELNHHKINYVEFATKDLSASKLFFQTVFNWQFKDYGPEYSAIEEGGLDGGFYQADTCARTENGSALVVLYSANLEATQQSVTAAGGIVIKEIFPFPGGRRFQFLEPGGNELAVWSDI